MSRRFAAELVMLACISYAFTGQNAAKAGFYVDYQYERALKFLEWMTGLIHMVNEFRNVGMLEVVNEPVQENDKASSMRQNSYPKAFEQVSSQVLHDPDVLIFIPAYPCQRD